MLRKLIFSILFLLSTAVLAADKTVILQVKGLSCPLCAGALEKQFKKISGVKKVTVHLSEAKVTVIIDETIDDKKRLIEAVEEAGFTLGDIEKVETKQ